MVQFRKTLFVFLIDSNGLIHLRGQLGVKFHENNGRQRPESEKWTPKTAYRRRVPLVMHIISPCVRPKGAQKQNVLIFPMNFEGSGGPRVRQENL